MRYYIADSHFFHRNLLDKMDCRGFESVEEMNEYMLNKWNNKVRDNDEVIILGDISLGTAEETSELLNKLNGRLFLIKGNHDRFLDKPEYGLERFEWVKDYAELSDNKRKVVVCHYPICCYNLQYRVDEEGNPKSYMLYGHIHNTDDEKLLNEYILKTRSYEKIGPDNQKHNIPCNMINCFCMFSDYEPLTLDEWIENDKKRRLEISL